MKSKFEWVRKAQRCLRMLELHRLGYQQLRGMSYFNAQVQIRNRPRLFCRQWYCDSDR